MKVAIEAGSLRPFMRLLEQGMILEIPEGASVREAAVAHFGMDPGYLENRVKTLFLNGKPVDDLDRASVLDGSVLALSAAMPGLVGATMRRDSYYAAMRQKIESTASLSTAGKTLCRVTIKLFNMVARDLGEVLFKGGIRIPGRRFCNFLMESAETLEGICNRIAADGSPTTVSGLLTMDLDKGDVFLTLTESSL